MGPIPPKAIAVVLAIFVLLLGGIWILNDDGDPASPDAGDDLGLTDPIDADPDGSPLDEADGSDELDPGETGDPDDVLVGEDDPDDELLQEALDNTNFLPTLREEPGIFEGDLDGYLVIGNVGDAETIDGAYLPRNFEIERPGFTYSDPDRPSGLPPDSFPGSRIVGASAFLSSTDRATRDSLYNNTEFGCGETNGRHRTICARGGPIESDQLTVIVFFEGAVPVDDTGNQQFTYSLVLDADGDRRNNYTAQPPFEWDTYQDTDYWIELIGENDQWKLQVTNWAAGDERGTTLSDARAVIRDRAIFFIVPLADLPATPVAYRTTTFVTDLDNMFDPEVSGTDAFPGPPNFGLNPISAKLNPIVIELEN